MPDLGTFRPSDHHGALVDARGPPGSARLDMSPHRLKKFSSSSVDRGLLVLLTAFTAAVRPSLAAKTACDPEVVVDHEGDLSSSNK